MSSNLFSLNPPTFLYMHKDALPLVHSFSVSSNLLATGGMVFEKITRDRQMDRQTDSYTLNQLVVGFALYKTLKMSCRIKTNLRLEVRV